MNGNAEVRKATARCTRCRKIGNGSRDVAQGLVVVVGMVVVGMIVVDEDAEERHRVRVRGVEVLVVKTHTGIHVHSDAGAVKSVDGHVVGSVGAQLWYHGTYGRVSDIKNMYSGSQIDSSQFRFVDVGAVIDCPTAPCQR